MPVRLENNVTQSFLAGKSDRRADEALKLQKEASRRADEALDLRKDRDQFDRGVTREKIDLTERQLGQADRRIDLAETQESRLGEMTAANIKSLEEQGKRAKERLDLDREREERFKKQDEQLYRMRAAELSNVLRQARRDEATWNNMRDPKVLAAMARVIDPNTKEVDPADFTFLGQKLGAGVYDGLSSLRRQAIESQAMVDIRNREANLADVVYQQQQEELERTRAQSRENWYNRAASLGVDPDQLRVMEMIDLIGERLPGSPDQSPAQNAIDQTEAFKKLKETIETKPEEVFKPQGATPLVADTPKEMAEFRLQAQENLYNLMPMSTVDIDEKGFKTPKKDYREQFDMANRIYADMASIDPNTGQPFPNGGMRMLSVAEEAALLKGVNLPVAMTPEANQPGFWGKALGAAKAMADPGGTAARSVYGKISGTEFPGDRDAKAARASADGADLSPEQVTFSEPDVQATIDQTIVQLSDAFGEDNYEPEAVYQEVGKALRLKKGSPLSVGEIRYINSAVGKALLGGPTEQQSATPGWRYEKLTGD